MKFPLAVSCGLPNPHGFLLGARCQVPEALRAFPHMGSSTQWVPIITFPIKAPTRQMLYPLSYRGALPMSGDVSCRRPCGQPHNIGAADFQGNASKIKETDPTGAVSLSCNWLKRLMPHAGVRCFPRKPCGHLRRRRLFL